MRTRTMIALPALLVVFSAAEAVAQEAAPPRPPEMTADPTRDIPGVPRIPTAGYGQPTQPPVQQRSMSGFSGSFGGALLFEKIQEDFFTSVELYNQTTIGPLTFGLLVPLRFRVWDGAPDDPGVLRETDWDEPSDYARILRFVELNLGGDTWRFRGRFGSLDGQSIGHGTLVGGYFNTIDRDHYQAGLAIDSAIKWGGVEFMLDNLLAPEIFALRLHVRPTLFFTDNPWAKRLIVGLSVAADTDAPLTLRDADKDGRPDLDGQRNLLESETSGVSLVGLDVEYAAVQTKLLDVVPYMDINILSERDTGAGLHVGVFFNVRIPTPLGPTIQSRLEYRVVGGGYAPRYIDSTYEAQRLQYDPDAFRDPTSSLPLTKLAWLRRSTSGTHGWLGELYVDVGGWVRAGGSYEDYDGPKNAALSFGVHLPKIELLQLGLYYTRRGFDGLSDAFDLDGAMLIAYVRSKVYGPLALTAVYQRSWALKSDGSYEAQGDFSVGAGLAFGY